MGLDIESAKYAWNKPIFLRIHVISLIHADINDIETTKCVRCWRQILDFDSSTAVVSVIYNDIDFRKSAQNALIIVGFPGYLTGEAWYCFQTLSSNSHKKPTDPAKNPKNHHTGGDIGFGKCASDIMYISLLWIIGNWPAFLRRFNKNLAYVQILIWQTNVSEYNYGQITILRA